MQTGLEALLLSPHFVFRSEAGAGTPDAHGRVKLTPHELAAAISYTIADAPPDAALAAAADEGRLETATQVREHVVRLLGKLESNAVAARFLSEYFAYGHAGDVFKDPMRAPDHDADALIASTDAWVKDALSVRESFIEHVLTTKAGFVNAAVASTYGLSASASRGNEFTRVMLPEDQRAGILTQPSFLVAFSKNDATDPIERGKFISKSLLCSSLPDVPPPDVPPLPDLGPNATVREQLAVHRNAEPQCKACHDLMDPLGLGLEAYDDLGRFRTTEKGRPVDATGTIMGTGDQDGPFDGAVELGRRLAASAAVEQCVVRHTFKFWMGRDEQGDDACALADALRSYKDHGGDLGAVLASILTSNAFLFRTPAR